MSQHPVVVVGAGPSGVSMAVSLLDRGLRPLLIDQADCVGSSWRCRYDRLKLNTARPLSHLPNRRYPKGTPLLPTATDVAEHLHRHAHEDGIGLRLGTTVERLERRPHGWCLQTSTGDIDARQVVVATGYERWPFIPAWPGVESFTGQLLHSAAYRNPVPYLGKRVLVVGGGSSGMEIVHDVATGGAHTAWLSIRTPPNIAPRRAPGAIPSDFAATLLYHLPVGVADVIAGWGRRVCLGELTEFGLPVPAVGPFTREASARRAPAIVDREVIDAIRKRRFEIVGEIASFHGPTVWLTSGDQLQPDAVICATGYRRGLEPLVGHLGVLDPSGVPRVEGEVPAAEGLRFIGFLSRPALLGHVARQSRRVAKAIASELERNPAPSSATVTRNTVAQ